ncbi:sensor histidine kinase [Paenibacillus alginolyticus]|nr:HAMP domain-containing sensor histidine kinase [Paenibacillus alginolyticus]
MARKAIIPIAKAYAKQREFVADASRELRTPLSVMLTSIEALQLEESIDSDPFSKNVLNGMKEEVNSITKLAGELLHLARSDSGEFELDRSVFNLSEAAARAISKLQPLAQAKDIDIELHASHELTVNWDAEKLSQLLILLIDNAIKTGQGHRTRIACREQGKRGSLFHYRSEGSWDRH